jgi:hypothetical protein
MASASGGDEAAHSIGDYADALAEGIVASLPTWVVRCVERTITSWSGSVTPEISLAAEVAAEHARDEVGPAISELLARDIDAQSTTPLAILRTAVLYPTEVLRQAGVPPVERDRYVESVFPDDLYDLAPASLADLDPALAELGIAWGAAKAFEHKRRHRS